jgi:hypothetical protein
MTKDQLESIRSEMASYAFDTSSYLKLNPMTLNNEKRQAAAKKKTKTKASTKKK